MAPLCWLSIRCPWVLPAKWPSNACPYQGVIIIPFTPNNTSLIARFMGPTWGPSGPDRTQVGPMLAPWILLSEIRMEECKDLERSLVLTKIRCRTRCLHLYLFRCFKRSLYVRILNLFPFHTIESKQVLIQGKWRRSCWWRPVFHQGINLRISSENSDGNLVF